MVLMSPFGDVVDTKGEGRAARSRSRRLPVADVWAPDWSPEPIQRSVRPTPPVLAMTPATVPEKAVLGIVHGADVIAAVRLSREELMAFGLAAIALAEHLAAMQRPAKVKRR